MTSLFSRLIASAALLALPFAAANAAVTTNEAAPTFTAQSASGESVNLSDFAGKTVVLEWSNHECPFVEKFYEGGHMQAFQQQATEGGDVAWLRVVSSAEGKQGFVTAEDVLQQTSEQGYAATHTLLDPTGELGRLYGAKTTPHMFVINAEGVLVYQGAIDDKRSTNSADIEGATNYVMAALAALAQGELPEVQETQPYGCSVKY
jgi:hypothetical protein